MTDRKHVELAGGCRLTRDSYLIMLLHERIDRDFVEAAKRKDSALVARFRLLKAALTNRKIEAGLPKVQPLPDDQVIALLSSELKRRLESAETYAAASRPELAAHEQADAELIRQYLPTPLTSVELEALIDAALASTGATTKADFGKVMGALAADIKGRADGQQVAALVKSRLTG